MSDQTPFEQFFAFRRFQPVAELTPDGESVLFASNISGQFNLWSARVDGGWPDQLTTFTENTVRGVAVREDGTILFIADRDGDEFHQIYRIPADGGRFASSNRRFPIGGTRIRRYCARSRSGSSARRGSTSDTWASCPGRGRSPRRARGRRRSS